MSGRLAIDFGTSNTVVAVWDETRQEGVPLHISDYGKTFQQGMEQISVIPSLIHYESPKQQWLGNQVLQRNLYESPQTFRWMKRYILNRNAEKVKVHGQSISPFEAGKNFLTAILLFAREETNLHDEEVALTIPVEAYEHYEDWLTSVAESAGITRFRLIDEASAAALGYGTHIQPGNVYLIFDFGGATLNVAIVLIEAEEEATAGRRCRVIGKAGRELGGSTIDQWLFQEFLQQNERYDSDDDIRPFSRAILVDCERAKERLSQYERAEISMMNPDTGAVLNAEVTRTRFEEILESHKLFTEINQTLQRAIKDAYERGYDEDRIKAVLMVGGSSQIPSIQRTLKHRFGDDRVMLNRPLDAIARGAAAFVAGVDFYDHIQHDYAIRSFNSQRGDYEYIPIVKRGTHYPTTEPLKRQTVKSTLEGQTHLGVSIFELGIERSKQVQQDIELVFDPSGAARFSNIMPDTQERRTHFWMNEHSPTFLLADPPCQEGEARFSIEFQIDGNKRLLMTARDLKTGKLIYRDYPVVKLT